MINIWDNGNVMEGGNREVVNMNLERRDIIGAKEVW